MIRFACFAILIVSMIGGCKDLGSTTASDDTTGSQAISPKFVVDMFAVECTVKVNPGTDSLCAYFPWSVKYHFEGRPGTVDRVGFVPVGFLATDLNIGPFLGIPDSVGDACYLSHGFWTNSSLGQSDSVVVQFDLSGVYWDRVDGATGRTRVPGPNKSV